MEAVWQWAQDSGVWAVLVVWLALVWRTVKPLIWDLAQSLIALIRQEQVRQALLTWVRAAEQIWGPQSAAASPDVAKQIGERKYAYVADQAKTEKLRVTPAQIEAAVHEVKAGAATVKLPVERVAGVVTKLE